MIKSHLGLVRLTSLCSALYSFVHSKSHAGLDALTKPLSATRYILPYPHVMIQPTLRTFNEYGVRVDEVKTSAAWKAEHVASAEEGLVALAYEKGASYVSRLQQFAKLLMYVPSSGMYSCPLAMTDGAARLLELLLMTNSVPEKAKPLAKEAFEHLTSRDGKQFWTSGQWMTEQASGSDVSMSTKTIARPQPDGSYKLYGFKWFTSAVDAEVSVALARIVPDDFKVGDDSVDFKQYPLSCFLLRLRDPNTGKLQGIRVQRLKQKLGTKQLPTAELELDGVPAFLLSEPGRGVATIAHLFNITRLHNSVSAVGYLRRMLAMARDYAHRRFVFGSLLAKNPLHLEGLAELDVEYRGMLYVTLEVAKVQGQIEEFERQVAAKKPVSEGARRANIRQQALLRILTPLSKLYTAKTAVVYCSEGIELFGAAGYMEDTKIPRILRDAQVLTIWEGTTNVCSDDVIRVFKKNNTKSKDTDAWIAFESEVRARLDCAANAKLSDASNNADVPAQAIELVNIPELCDMVRNALDQVKRFLVITGAVDPQKSFIVPLVSEPKPLPPKDGALWLHARARVLSMSLYRIYMAATMLQHAEFTADVLDWVAVHRFITTRELVSPTLFPPSGKVHPSIAATALLALDIGPISNSNKVGPRGFGEFHQHDPKLPRSQL